MNRYSNRYSIEYDDKCIQFEHPERYIPHLLETIVLEGEEYIVDFVRKKYNFDDMCMEISISCHKNGHEELGVVLTQNS